MKKTESGAKLEFLEVPLIFMSDDQGPWALHCAGSSELRTPNIDQLASEGIRFENFFCVSPVCSPARASFLTGRIPSQHGVHDWIAHGNMIDPEGRTWHRAETRIEYLKGMTAFTDILAEAGYTCGISGKWHLGASDIPQKSHDFWCVHSLGGSEYKDYWVFDESTEMQHKTEYITDFFTDRAINFLDKQCNDNAKQPFCLSVHYTAPHAPWYQHEQPADIWGSYENTEFSLPVEPSHPWGDWKYIERYPSSAYPEGGPNELYHLSEDPGEKNNLTGDPAHKNVREALAKQLNQWFANYEDPELSGANLFNCEGVGQINKVSAVKEGTPAFHAHT